jgi:hypothetical protein
MGEAKIKGEQKALIESIKRKHEAAIEAVHHGYLHAIACGQDLIKAKRLYGRDKKWNAWRSAYLPFISERTDRLYRSLASKANQAKIEEALESDRQRVAALTLRKAVVILSGKDPDAEYETRKQKRELERAAAQQARRPASSPEVHTPSPAAGIMSGESLVKDANPQTEEPPPERRPLELAAELAITEPRQLSNLIKSEIWPEEKRQALRRELGVAVDLSVWSDDQIIDVISKIEVKRRAKLVDRLMEAVKDEIAAKKREPAYA